LLVHRKKFEQYISERGVGSKDKVADSVKSYVSYLNGVSKHLNIEINPDTLSTQSDIEELSSRLHGKVSPRTLHNYRTAMKRYIEMLQEGT